MSEPVEAPPGRTPDASPDARQAEPGAESGAGTPLLEQFETLYAAARTLGISLQRFFGALGQLLLAEGKLARHGAPLFFIGTIGLIALAVSLWICTVALAGWALATLTHSVGIALGILVLGHVVLILALWFALRHGIRQASFPQSRAELRALGHRLTREWSETTPRQPARTDTQS